MFDLGNPHYQYLLVLPLLILVAYFTLDLGEIKNKNYLQTLFSLIKLIHIDQKESP